MTVQLFMFLFTIGSIVSSLLTQAMKKAFSDISSNLLAAFDALIIGLGGTTVAYILLDIAFDLKSIICIGLMAICVWVGSMIGYDKVLQTMEQLGLGKK